MLLVVIVAILSSQQMVTRVNGEGHYTVIASEKINPNSYYNISVSVCNNEQPVELKIGIEGPTNIPKQTVQMAKMMDLKLISFKTPKLQKEGQYNLTVEGVKGLVFKNTTKLIVGRTHINLVLQTDQYLYAPGDVVNYRVVFLNDFLRPVKPTKKAVIYVTDGKNKRVYEKTNFTTIQGVFTDQFKVPNSGALGAWKLGVEKINESAIFSVKKKPKYLIKVKATKGVYIKEDKLEIRASAKEYDGKLINGKVSIDLELVHYKEYYDGKIISGKDWVDLEKINKKFSAKHDTTMINGEAKLILDLRQYESLLKGGIAITARITVTVTEDSSGEKIIGKDDTTFYPYRYRMSCPVGIMCNRFFPSKSQMMPFHITHVNGSLINDSKSIVRVTFSKKKENTTVETSDDLDRYSYETHLDDFSNAIFYITLPSKFNAYTVELEYGGEKHILYDVVSWYHMLSQVAYSLSKRTGVVDKPFQKREWFKIHRGTHKLLNILSANESVKFSVTSSKPISFFNYIVIGHDNVLMAERVDLPKPKNTHTFSFKPTYFMAPYSRLYVYYLNEKNEFYHAETNIHFEMALKNKMEVLAPKEVKPGTDVTITIKTAPDSLVALTAVDRGLLELDGVEDDFIKLKYNSFFTQIRNHFKAKQLPGRKITNILALTNGNPIVYKSKETKTQEPVKVPSLGDLDIRDYHNYYDSIQNSLSRTWLFDNIVQKNTNEYSLTKTIPNTSGPTTWILSAFAVHPMGGLAVEKKILTIMAKKPGQV